MASYDSPLTYESPFSWRYGSPIMRALWSEVEKRRRWRQIWVALADAESQAGLVTAEQVADLRKHVDDVDLERASEIEAEIRHDVMAEVRTFAEQCKIGGGIIHLGATSMDISDNAEVLRIRDAIDLILNALDTLLGAFAEQIEKWADTPCMGWTHLQPAEPTTIGYRLATYAQDLLADQADLRRVRSELRGKGIKGAVGSAASYAELLLGTEMAPADLESRIMATLGLPAFPIATQTYPRRQDYIVLSALAGLAGSLYHFAFDLRLLQSPPFGEWSEPFGAKQVGSSAMPFKRNPISAENIDSLGRMVAALPRVAWDNAAHSLLERTLDDSANRRVIIPEAFLAVDEMIGAANRIVSGLRLDERAIDMNLTRYGVFAASERVLMALGRVGADRQAMHERIREHSLAAWDAIRQGKANPLVDLLAGDEEMAQFLPGKKIRQLMDASDYIGDAPSRAHKIVEAIRGSQGRETAGADHFVGR
ncbi:MAG: adenylosuccinate lyase [Anaerolineae bacterium]|nr:adenylosuccinate lyase [Anaerolineae bacterium]